MARARGTLTAGTQSEIVRAESLVKRFGSNVVLDGLEFVLGESQVACLIGASGSGKTTFLRCINQLETYEAGRLLVKGELIGYRQVDDLLVPLSGRERVRQRRGIGMVFQQFNLFRHMTVVQNMIEAPVRVLGKGKEEARERAHAALDRVGMGKFYDRYPGQLSGGQQQRVAIARALVLEPDLMLFDEPTSALDPELVQEVLEVMRGLASEGMSMIVATHQMGFAKEVADTTAFLDAGRIVEQGPSRDVIDSPRSERLQSFLEKLL